MLISVQNEAFSPVMDVAMELWTDKKNNEIKILGFASWMLEYLLSPQSSDSKPVVSDTMIYKYNQYDRPRTLENFICEWQLAVDKRKVSSQALIGIVNDKSKTKINKVSVLELSDSLLLFFSQILKVICLKNFVWASEKSKVGNFFSSSAKLIE